MRLLLIAATLFAMSAHAAPPTVSLTSSASSTTAPGSVTLTWTSTGAVSCTASAAPAIAAWTGTKALSGTQTITNLLTSTQFTLDCATSTRIEAITVTWTRPTLKTDTTPLAPGELTGYRIYYGTNPTALTNTLVIANPATLAATVAVPSAGTWFVVMTSQAGTLESLRTNAVSAVTANLPGERGAASVSIAVTALPEPPGNVQLQVIDPLAFDVRFNESRWAVELWGQVGIAKLGAACNEDKCLQVSGVTYCGVYQRRQVTLSRVPRSATVVARCG